MQLCEFLVLPLYGSRFKRELHQCCISSFISVAVVTVNEYISRVVMCHLTIDVANYNPCIILSQPFIIYLLQVI